MAFSATQYLFKASMPTSIVTTTVGGYTVPAATRFSIIAMTLANTATTNVMTYADVSLFDGTTAYPVGVKFPLYPGGNLVVQGMQKHTLPSGGAAYVTAYSTNVSVIMTGVEIT
jgi:hypothetical protein